MTAPLAQRHAITDPFVALDRARKIAAAAREAGGAFDLCEHEAGHAFMREGDPSAYHEASAELAWERTMTFLRAHLAG